jgi:dTDP-4-dehydrorhamnose reductase
MRVLVTGASGQLGGYLLRELQRRGDAVMAWSGTRTGRRFGYDLRPLDLADADQIADAFRQARPDAVIHAGALATVAECYQDPDRARRVNVEGTAALADLAGRAGTRLIHVSTDLVFDGEHAPYREEDVPAPVSVYGRSKADAEPPVLACPRGVVVRVSLMFGPTLVGRPSFFDEQVAALYERRPVTLFADEWRTPLSYLTAARALVALLAADMNGLLHVGGPERLSRLSMGRRLAVSLGADPSAICALRREQAPLTEPRPRDVSLDSSRWRRRFPELPWPAWEAALREISVRA